MSHRKKSSTLISEKTSTYPVAAPSGTTLALGTSEIAIPSNASKVMLYFRLSSVTDALVNTRVYLYSGHGNAAAWLNCRVYALDDLQDQDDDTFAIMIPDPWMFDAIAPRMILLSGAATMSCDVTIIQDQPT